MVRLCERAIAEEEVDEVSVRRVMAAMAPRCGCGGHWWCTNVGDGRWRLAAMRRKKRERWK